MENSHKPVVVGLGEILWDMLPGGRQLGGAPANFAYHAHTMGAETYILSRIGNDPLGDDIIAKLDSTDLSHEYIQRDDTYPTGTVSVEIDSNGQPSYVIHESVAWDFLQYDNALLQLATRTDAVCFGSLSQRCQTTRTSICEFLETVPAGSLKVFDINLRQDYFNLDIVLGSLTAANVLKLNDDELLVLAQMLELSGEADELPAVISDKFELKMLVLTRGANGSVLFADGKTSIHRGVVPSPLVDTVGAGDSFTAAVTMGLLDGLDIDEINDNANHRASYVCTQCGGMPPIAD